MINNKYQVSCCNSGGGGSGNSSAECNENTGFPNLWKASGYAKGNEMMNKIPSSLCFP